MIRFFVNIILVKMDLNVRKMIERDRILPAEKMFTHYFACFWDY